MASATAMAKTAGIARPLPPLPVDDPKVRQPNIDKARKLLGWEPQMSLEEGLQRTIDYFATLIQKGIV